MKKNLRLLPRNSAVCPSPSDLLSSSGSLFLCGTPIGNLNDATFRLIQTLRDVDLIVAEDTRRIRILLDRFDIQKKEIISCPHFNEKQAASLILSKLKQGFNVAFVSDAGMPLVSDPGVLLVRLCRNEGIMIICIPGPSAILTAISASGFTSSKFIFDGFLPKELSSRREYFDSIKDERRAVVVFESPRRLIETLMVIDGIVPFRDICIGREMTKKFEEFRFGKASELIGYFSKASVRGEFTVVIEGCQEGPQLPERDADEIIKILLDEGVQKKLASKIVSRLTSLSARVAYQKMVNADERNSSQS